MARGACLLTNTNEIVLLLYTLVESHRALSLRNLVLGYECGRVFPAGVGPGSLSRDAADWLSSRFSRSVETRRRYSSSNLAPFEGWPPARGRGHCRGKPLVRHSSALSGKYAPDTARVEGSSVVDEPAEC